MKIIANARATSYENGRLVVESPGGTIVLETTVVVESVRYAKNDTLFEEPRYDDAVAHKNGDVWSVANIMTAPWDAYELSSSL